MGAAGLPYTFKNFLPACILVQFQLPAYHQSQGKFTQRREAGTLQLKGWARGQGWQQLGLGKTVPPGPGFQGAAVSCEFRGRRDGQR